MDCSIRLLSATQPRHPRRIVAAGFEPARYLAISSRFTGGNLSSSDPHDINPLRSIQAVDKFGGKGMYLTPVLIVFGGVAITLAQATHSPIASLSKRA
jgi:hypothetical protein